MAHSNGEPRNILDETLEAGSEVSEAITLRLSAERRITGDSHLPASAGRPRALITGGSHGIGRGTALIMAEEGYDLCITYHSDEEEAREVKDYVETTFDARCVIVEVDLASEAMIDTMIETAWRELGGIDVLVNNAGITIFEEAFEDTVDTADTLYEVNYRGTILAMTKVAARWRDEAMAGSIINVSSIHADTVYEHDAMYGGLKAGLERATKTYALQYAPYGIRVNAVAPGSILIERTEEGHDIETMNEAVPLGRSGLPRDIAHAVLFLASERASYITGISILVDGGMALSDQPV